MKLNTVGRFDIYYLIICKFVIMIRTVLIPDSDTVSISVPKDYIGKVLEVIAFTKDEALNKDTTAKKAATFTVLHTDVKDYRFNRDEANER